MAAAQQGLSSDKPTINTKESKLNSMLPKQAQWAFLSAVAIFTTALAVSLAAILLNLG